MHAAKLLGFTHWWWCLLAVWQASYWTMWLLHSSFNSLQKWRWSHSSIWSVLVRVKLAYSVCWSVMTSSSNSVRLASWDFQFLRSCIRLSSSLFFLHLCFFFFFLEYPSHCFSYDWLPLSHWEAISTTGLLSWACLSRAFLKVFSLPVVVYSEKSDGRVQNLSSFFL